MSGLSPAILVAVGDASADAWLARFREEAPGRDIRPWPQGMGDPGSIGYVAAWRAPHGLMTQFPHLRAIFNLGAGVDHLLADPSLSDVPVVRAVDPDLTMRMVEYVTLHVLMHHRRQRLYDAQQRERVWRGHPQPAAAEVAVGIMGLGAIGGAAADTLRRIGFRVAGWTRTPRERAGIEVFCGPETLDAFLERSEILACVLPYTPATEGILALPLLRKLKRDGALGGAYLVNAGRGKLQVEADILSALAEGSLAGATLDVFSTEPLPPESPLWAHPQVTVTPHNAGDVDPGKLVTRILQQIERFEAGLPMTDLVDRARGY